MELKPPDHIRKDKLANTKWKETVAHLQKLDLLDTTDPSVIEQYVGTFAAWQKLHLYCLEHGETGINYKGDQVVSPQARQRNALANQLNTLRRELALTPMSRYTLRSIIKNTGTRGKYDWAKK